jgi:cysteine synthase A
MFQSSVKSISGDLAEATMTARFARLEALIGNTPLLEIHYKYKNRPRVVYAKAEHLNLTGSIKDRMAFQILREAYRSGQIEPGDTIAEVTSGNTGISVSAIGRAFGHPVTIFMPDWMSRERVSLITAYGAKIVPVSREQGGFVGSLALSEELHATHSHVFLPHQFSNCANIDAHAQTTAPEIERQLQSIGKQPDAFVAGVGTGGTIMGVGKRLREKYPTVRLHPIEPQESPTLSTGHHKGSHRIQGISDEFIPPICHLDELDSVIGVSDGDAILMAQKLAAEIGLAVGTSSGANFIGALITQNELGEDAIVVTVFADDNKKYLSTDLLRTEPIKKDYLSNDVEFSFYRAIPRTGNENGDLNN